MSVPNHQLDPPDYLPCLKCKLQWVWDALVTELELAGMATKYAKEIADDAIQEAKAHFDPSEYRTCDDCAFQERAD